jgi:hypothetical protein
MRASCLLVCAGTPRVKRDGGLAHSRRIGCSNYCQQNCPSRSCARVVYCQLMGTNDSLPEKTQIVNAYLYDHSGGIVFNKEVCMTITTLANFLYVLETITLAMIRTIVGELAAMQVLTFQTPLPGACDTSSSGG